MRRIIVKLITILLEVSYMRFTLPEKLIGFTMQEKLIVGVSGFILLVILINGGFSFLSPLIFRSSIQGKIAPSIEQINQGNTIYIANIIKERDNYPTPYIIENKLLLGRFDRTNVYAYIRSNEGQCISAKEYGIRLYTKFYKGLTDIKIHPCK